MCFQRSQTWTGIELQNNRVASHWYISQGAGRNFQNICNQFPNVNLLLMIMSHYPILRIKVKTPCNILHTVTTFCKSNSLPALMTLTDLPELPQLCFLFLLKKKKNNSFSSLFVSMSLKNAVYSCWLTAFSIDWYLFSILCNLKSLLIFFSGYVQDLLCVGCSHYTCSSQRWLPSSYRMLLPAKIYATLPVMASGSSCCFFINCGNSTLFFSWMFGSSLISIQLCSLSLTPLGCSVD